MSTSTQLGKNVFQILLYRNNATEILLETGQNGLRLPALLVPAAGRMAEEITSAVKIAWNLETYCLLSLPSSADSIAPFRCQVMEACRQGASAPCGMQWIPAVSLSARSFEDCSSFDAIERSLTTLDRHRRGELQGVFAKPGWLRVVTDWVESEACTVGLSLSGELLQLNASPEFSLIRFATDGPALWFKAVGEPNLREHPITCELATLFPQFLPRLLASQSEWNAWLTFEAEGTHLTARTPVSLWQQAASAFARFQLATCGNALHLIEVGCKDMRASTLSRLVRPFFEFAAQLMDEQSKATPAPLSHKQIRSIALEVETCLEQLLAGDLPNLLGHLDLNPANILVGGSNCVFLDWSEGAVGHPFLSFEYLREHWRRLHAVNSAAETALLSAYTNEWRAFFSPTLIEAALASAPLLAAFAFAAVGLPWQGPDTVQPRAIAGLLRSLTRRMKRETDALQNRRTACVL